LLQIPKIPKNGRPLKEIKKNEMSLEDKNRELE